MLAWVRQDGQRESVKRDFSGVDDGIKVLVFLILCEVLAMFGWILVHMVMFDAAMQQLTRELGGFNP